MPATSGSSIGKSGMRCGPECRAVAVVLGLTLWRVVALWFDRTDLFVDEAQYWLWGERLDFGYYSKPPLIAWVIRAVTEAAGSADPFWVRLAAPLFHGATAVLILVMGRRLAGAAVGAWAAVIYITLPIVAVGSYLISTDTILAPFFAAGLIFWWQAARCGGSGAALAAGLCIGAAFMAKYAAVYFFLGAVLAMAVPATRASGRQWAALAAGFLVAAAPNIIWNVVNDFSTVSHTLDNVEWVRPEADDTGGWGSLARFLGSQFAVFGPIFMALLIALTVLPKRPEQTVLLLFSLPVIVLVGAQAYLAKAYGNWAFPAYLSAAVLVAWWLAERGRRLWLAAAVALNTLASLAVPLLIMAPEAVRLGDGRLLMARYLGRDALAQDILALARERGAGAVVSDNRDLLAALLHSGRDGALPVLSTNPPGPPAHYYQQTFPYVPGAFGRVLLVTGATLTGCGAPVALDSLPGSFDGRRFNAYLLDGECAELGT